MSNRSPITHKRPNADTLIVHVRTAPDCQPVTSTDESPGEPPGIASIEFRYEEASSGKKFTTTRTLAELTTVPLFAFDPHSILPVCSREPDSYDTKAEDSVEVEWTELVAKRPHRVAFRLPYVKPEGFSVEAAAQADLVRSLKHRVKQLETEQEDLQREFVSFRKRVDVFMSGMQELVTHQYSTASEASLLLAMQRVGAPRKLTPEQDWRFAFQLLETPLLLQAHLRIGLNPNISRPKKHYQVLGCIGDWWGVGGESLLAVAVTYASGAGATSESNKRPDNLMRSVQILLESKADPHQKDQGGRSALDWCKAHATGIEAGFFTQNRVRKLLNLLQ